MFEEKERNALTNNCSVCFLFFREVTLYKKGDNCIDALAIKKMLIKLYIYGAIKTKADENGKIGTGTVEAVKECQKLTGRKQTGNIEAADVKSYIKACR